MSQQTLKVAAIQMVSNDDISSNLERAKSLIQQAVKEQNVQLAVLPENFLCFDAKQYLELAQEADRYIDEFAQLAKQLKVNIVLGSLPVKDRPDGSLLTERVRSASILLDDQGSVLTRYDKIHLFDVDVKDGHGAYRESNEIEPGDQVVVAQLDAFNIGFSICYDLRFAGLYHELRRLGANIILVPAAFTEVTGRAHWEPLLRSRAIETQSYVIAANQGGQHSARRSTWGHSMIIDPWGEVISQLDTGEGYCSAELDLGTLEEIRKKMPVFEHQRF